jgi:TIR domain/Protein of unknown function (DUF1566)
MTTIFISYRRDDAAAYAGRLYDGLRRRYGEDHVFMDVDHIQPGEDFAAVIERSVRGADVALVVIGKKWLSAANDAGQRRLDDPADFVRLEVKAALDTGRRVIPVLVGDAGMPPSHALPPPLQRLAGVQAVTMSNERWDYDAERLVRSIDGGSQPIVRRKWMWMGAVMAMGAAGLAGWMMTRQPPQAPSPTPPPSSPPTVTLRAGPAVVTAEQARTMVAQRDFFHARWNAGGGKAALELERQVLGSDVVIKDKYFQLMWQQNATARPFDRNGAGQTLQELNARGFAGYSDWRLPTLEEAMSLMGSGTAEDCRLHKLFDRSGPIMRTGDTIEGGKDWIVYFCDGIAVPEVAGFNAHVRAVRSLR